MSLFAGVSALPAPNDPLVSQDDFVEWFSLPAPSASEIARIQTALEIASAQIRNNRRIFSPITNEIVNIDAYGGDTLLLPRNRLPVTVVTLVEQFNGTTYDTVDASEYSWSQKGYLERYWSYWPCRAQSVRVTYSHGYDILPRDVAGVCLSAAKRLYDQPDGGGGVQSEQLGDHHVTYFANAGVLLPQDEQILQHYESRA